jgi:hypothetical protein
MAKRIVGVIVAIAVIYLLWLGYVHYRDHLDENGEIHGELTHASSNADSDDTPVARPAPQPVQQQPVQTYTPAAPASDSIAPNPPNGMAFTGNGKFQVYRQGNLTWRVDTESGKACILFATMEEWRKPIVYSHGCNNS